MSAKLKYCHKCRGFKTFDLFYDSKKNLDGKRGSCVQCELGAARQRRYGISPEQFQELCDLQGNICPICMQQLSGKLTVDHDHSCCPQSNKTCGQCIRGVLHFGCNTAIGLLKDDVSRLRNAMDYLEGNRNAKPL